MKRLFMLAIASMVMLNVACDDKQETLPVVMTLTSSSVMDIDDKGGELVITYELTNVSSTENLQIITAADWIYVKDKSAVGRIELMIDANHEESNRMAPVIVTYADQRFDVEVRQSAKQSQGVGFVLTSSDTVEVNRAGGIVEVNYTIENALIGEEVSVETDADWISVYDRMSYQKVVLSVAINTENVERSADVDFFYGGESFTVTIQQTGDGQIIFNAAKIHGYYYGEQFSPGAGNYWIIFTDNGYDENGATIPYSTYYRIDAYGEIYDGDATEVEVPVGTYEFDIENTGDKGTFADDNSSYYVTDADGRSRDPRHYQSGKLVVEQNRMTLTVIIDGVEHIVVYEGRGKLKNVSDERMVNTTLVDDYAADLSDHHLLFENFGDYYDFGFQNWLVVIRPNATVGDNFNFDIITAYQKVEQGFLGDYVGADVLKASSYIYGFLFEDYMQASWFYTTDAQGTPVDVAPLREGNVSMYDNGNGTITIDIDVRDEIRNKITGRWVGELPEASPATVSRSIVVMQ